MNTNRKCVPGAGRLLGGLVAPVSGEALPDVEEVPGRAWLLATLPLATPPLARPAAFLGLAPDLACPAVDQVGRAPEAGLFSCSLAPAAEPRVPLAVAALVLAPLALAASRLDMVPLSSGEPAVPGLVLGGAGLGLAVLAPREAGASPGLPSAARPSDFMAAGAGRRAGGHRELGACWVRVPPGASEEEEGVRWVRVAPGASE